MTVIEKNLLWYKSPARFWEEALPLGNGRLGAMVFGRTDTELLQLNEDTLWSGYPQDKQNETALSFLPEARRLIMAGRFSEAQSLIEEKMLGSWKESYQPAGDLLLEWTQPATISNYRRELNLASATSTMRCQRNGAWMSEEIFISNPDQVLVMILETEAAEGMDITLRLCSQLTARVRGAMGGEVVGFADGKADGKADGNAGGVLELTGRGPSNVLPSYVTPESSDISQGVYDDPDHPGMPFAIRLAASQTGGTIEARGDQLQIRGAGRIEILLAIATGFTRYDQDPATSGRDPAAICRTILQSIQGLSAEQLKDRHLADHRLFFERVDLNLGGEAMIDLPTDERLLHFENSSEDLALVELMFQYGRYLMIASSRPGSQPANLQGIWNHEVRPPWSSNWTTNINAQMNYWPIESCNLGELAEPLFRMIAELAETGRETAARQFGCRGWTVCHNVDLWRGTAPVSGSATYAYWPMGGAWLCRQLWEHFLYTEDKTWLDTVGYPLMAGSARFLLDWLIEGPEGRLVTCPATSPENSFLTAEGRHCSVSMASTMDNAIIRDLFTACLEAGRLLNRSDAMLDEIRAALPRLAPYQIGAKGQLQEWFQDFPEAEQHHRHVSHLYGLYPGCQISPQLTPELAEACKKTLDLRGDESTGWSLAWKINLWARLQDGSRCWKLIRRLLKPVSLTNTNYINGGGTYPNLMDAHPPFQIDGNFGFTSGIAEMLVQSQLNVLHLLPALPGQWLDGSARGINAHGNLAVDLEWQQGRLRNVLIHARSQKEITVRYQDREWVMKLQPGENSCQIECPPGQA